jgi:hypothetical protein
MQAMNIEKTVRTSSRLSFGEYVQEESRKGKRNKPARGGKHRFEAIPTDLTHGE